MSEYLKSFPELTSDRPDEEQIMQLSFIMGIRELK
jgi:hypothetical protein